MANVSHYTVKPLFRVENPVNGTLNATGSIVCSTTIRRYYIDVGDGKDDLWEMEEFKAVCVTSGKFRH